MALVFDLRILKSLRKTRMGTDRATAPVEGYNEDAHSRVHQALFGIPDREMLQANERHIREGKLRMEHISSLIADAVGINPVTLSMLCFLSGRAVEILDDEQPADAAPVVSANEEGWRILISREKGIVWDGEESTILIPSLPHTTMNLVMGRPLCQVLSHPILDRFPLRIVGRRSDGKGTRLVLTGRRWLLPHEMQQHLQR